MIVTGLGVVLVLGVLALVNVAATTRAQAALWVTQFGSVGHDGATSAAVDATGGVFLAGWTSDALPGQTFAGGPRDAFVRRYTNDGVEMWTRQFGTPGQDDATAVAVDLSGAVYVVGQVGGALAGQTRTSGFDAYVRKYTADGTLVWTRQFGGAGGPDAATNASGVAVDADGGVYAAGWVFGTLPGQEAVGLNDVFVRKYTPDGDEMWTHQFGTADHDFASSISIDATGVVYLAGQSRGTAGDVGTTFVRSFARDGAEIARRDVGTEKDVTIAVTVDRTGAIYQVGERAHGTHVHDGGAHENHRGDPFVRKYAPDGTELWTQMFGAPTTDAITGVAVDTAGGVHVAGHTSRGKSPASPDTRALGFVRTFNAQGRPGPVRQFASSGYAVATGVTAGKPGVVYAFGWVRGALDSKTPVGPTDVFAAKVRP